MGENTWSWLVLLKSYDGDPKAVGSQKALDRSLSVERKTPKQWNDIRERQL